MTVLNLTHYVRIYDADLEPDFCRRMIDSFNARTRFHQPNGRGHRAASNNLPGRAQCHAHVGSGFAITFACNIDRALAAYNSDIGLTISIQFAKTADLIFKTLSSWTR